MRTWPNIYIMSQTVSYRFDVWAKGGRNLANTQVMGKQSPYLQVWTTTDPLKRSSAVDKDGGHEAVWGHSFGSLKAWDETTESLYLKVMNGNNWVSNPVIGSAEVPVVQLMEEDENEPVEKWFNIISEKGVHAGEVLIKFSWCKSTLTAGNVTVAPVEMTSPLNVDMANATPGPVDPIKPGADASIPLPVPDTVSSDGQSVPVRRASAPDAIPTVSESLDGATYVKPPSVLKVNVTAKTPEQPAVEMPVENSGVEQVWNQHLGNLQLDENSSLPVPPPVGASTPGEMLTPKSESARVRAQSEATPSSGSKAKNAFLKSFYDTKPAGMRHSVGTGKSPATHKTPICPPESLPTTLPLPVITSADILGAGPIALPAASSSAGRSAKHGVTSKSHLGHKGPLQVQRVQLQSKPGSSTTPTHWTGAAPPSASRVSDAAWVFDKGSTLPGSRHANPGVANTPLMVQGSALKLATPPNKHVNMPPPPPRPHLQGGREVVKPPPTTPPNPAAGVPIIMTESLLGLGPARIKK